MKKLYNTFSACMLPVTCKVNRIINTKIQLNVASNMLKRLATTSWIEPAHPLNTLSLLHTTYILNCLSTESLDWLTLYETFTGQKPDISSILAFHWWEPVYYSCPNASYSNTKECLARILGIAKYQGDAMTWLLLDNITLKVVTRSVVRTASDINNPNLRVGNHKPIHSVNGQ
jgi:hypothetical protein